jgi:hypothetical protein
MLPLLAPILSQLAGSGMQKVADAVMDKGLDAVEEKLGVKLTPNADGILDPAKLAEVEQAAMKHKEFMAELDHKDRESARAAHFAMVTNKDVPWYEKATMPFLAVFVVVSTFLLVGILCFINIADAQERIVIFVLGFVTAVAGQVLSFYFGSSQGSKDKTEAMRK